MTGKSTRLVHRKKFEQNEFREVKPAQHEISKAGYTLLSLGLALLLIELLLRHLSHRFDYSIDLSNTPILAFVALQIAAGIIYLIAVSLLTRIPLHRFYLLAMIAVGLIMRLLLFGSTPVLEVDFYRYLWDGAVSANGFNPYQLAPLQVPGSALDILSQQAGPVFERINYADLRTIYPPLTQAAFALCYWIDSWSLEAWRGLLLVADGIGFGLLLLLLRMLNKPLIFSLVYWWNPLLLQQTYNAAHMDILLVAPLLATLILIIRQRHLLASLTLTLAAAIKLWPLLLMPFVLRPLLSRPATLVATLIASGVAFAVLVFPLFYYGLGADSGLDAFAQQWQRNSIIFPLIESTLLLLTEQAAMISRALVAVMLIATVLWLNRKPASAEQLIRQVMWVIALLFLLSPSQFPWYSLWFLPLLCFERNPALLALTVLMPLYYLKFYFPASTYSGFSAPFYLWLQYLPPLMLLAWHGWPKTSFSSAPIRQVQDL